MPEEFLTILADTREQRIPPFPEGVRVERATLREGDYTSPRLVDVVRLERKSVSDLLGTLTRGRERFEREAERLLAFPVRAVVVEGSVRDVARAGRMHPNAVVGSMAALFARYGLPIIFVDTPEMAGRFIAGVLRRAEDKHHG